MNFFPKKSTQKKPANFLFLGVGVIITLILLFFFKVCLSDEDFTSCSLQPPGELGGGADPLGLMSLGVGGRHRGIMFLLLFLCILFHLSNRADACVLFSIPLKWPSRVTWDVGTRAAGKEARGGDTGWGRGANLPKPPTTQPFSREGLRGTGHSPAWSP